MKLKRFCAFVLLLTFSFAFLFATEHEYHLSFEPYLDCLWGVQEEYVLNDKYNDGIESLLEWQEKPLWLYGYRASFSVDGFGARFLMASAVPRECGTMYDSDWLDHPSSFKTNYSESDNNLDSYFQAELQLSYKFALGSYITLGPTAELGYRSIKFTAENLDWRYWGEQQNDAAETFYWYPEGLKTGSKVYGKHSVIDYRKNTFYTFIGFSLGATIQERFHMELCGAISPYSSSESVDNHFLNNYGIGTDYKDIVNSVFKTFKGDFTASVDCNDTFTVCFNMGGLYSRLASGKSYQKSRGGGSYELNRKFESGMAEHSFHLGLGLKIYIF